jgi:hypothetical protein
MHYTILVFSGPYICFGTYIWNIEDYEDYELSTTPLKMEL